MGKPILIRLPDGDFDYDGEEEDTQEDIEFQNMLEEWEFEMSTHLY